MKQFFILFICLLLTSCFEITEKIKHNSDQSGDYSLVVDFSSSWLKTKSAIMLEEVDGVSIPNEEDIKSKLAQFRDKAYVVNGSGSLVLLGTISSHSLTTITLASIGSTVPSPGIIS